METGRISSACTVILLILAAAVCHGSSEMKLMNTAPEVYINTPLIFTLTQGDSTYAIPVLEKAQDVVAFYNYYSASSHTGYEVAYESKVFLYRNTIDNSLHLIFTHNIDSPPPTGSGRVDFDLSGIPPGAYVSQSDDPSHGWDPPRTQEFSLAYSNLEGHWYYTDNTDGGVLSGLPLDTSWCIGIEPLYFNNINRWIYHFGSGDPIELEMDQSATICFTPPIDPEEVNIDEGGKVSFSGFFDDPDAYDTHGAVWEFGDSNDSTGTFWPGVGYTHHNMDPVVYTYGDDGDLTAFLTVTDNHGGVGSADVSVVIANVPPSVDAGADLTIDQGDTVTVTASFTDPGWQDTHTATIAWGDSHVDTAAVAEENDPPDATGTATGKHYYRDCELFTVSVCVADDDGGTGEDSLSIEVLDATPPEIVCPPDTTMAADHNCQVIYGGPSASATDNCDPNPAIESEPQLPARFTGIGTYEIMWTATDAAGNADSCVQIITVVDISPPHIACPPDTTIEADENCDVVYSGPYATASDNCDSDPFITSIPAVPARFNGVGEHTITWVAVDASGNADTCHQTVTAIDVTPPEITCPPDVVMEADENCQVIYVGPPAKAADNCDRSPAVTSIPPLPAKLTGVGDHDIVYTARDASGNSSTCTQTVTIIDVSPPWITCPPDVALEPEDLNCYVTYTGPSASASDNCDTSPMISSEPPLPARFGSIGDHIIVFSAVDFSSNASHCTLTVTVSPTSFCLKQEAIDSLEALKPTGKSQLDREIDKVIWHIEKSLDQNLWLDVKHLGCKHGHKVFNEEKTAVVHLVKELNKKKFPAELVDDFKVVITMLLDADEVLARVQLDDAIAAGGEEKQIQKAEEQMILAFEKRQEDDYMHAIDHYRKAWDLACKAMKGAELGGVQVGAETRSSLAFGLLQNRPNPFGQSTAIYYQMPVSTHVRLRVFDLAGRLVRSLVDEEQNPGEHMAEWDGRHDHGTKATPGIYFARLTAGDFSSSLKMILVD